MYTDVLEHIEKNYPEILGLFSDFLQTEEYNNCSSVSMVDKLGYARTKALEAQGIKVVGFYENNEYYNQFVGFLFGFKVASRLIREVYSN
ncbi:MAG: hypothetical protein RR233_01325 [Clostridiales bacterium]